MPDSLLCMNIMRVLYVFTSGAPCRDTPAKTAKPPASMMVTTIMEKYYDYLINKKSPDNYKPGDFISKKILKLI